MSSAAIRSVVRWAGALIAVAGLSAACTTPESTATASLRMPPTGEVTIAATVVARASAPASKYPLGPEVFPTGKREALPEVAGTTLDGRTLAVSSLRGNVVVLNVWASWCQPCQAESPALVALAGTTGSRVRFVGLDENDTTSAARAFLRPIGSTYPQLPDRGLLLAKLSRWLPAAVPGSLVLDPRGRVAARVVGPVTAAQLRPLLVTATRT